MNNFVITFLLALKTAANLKKEIVKVFYNKKLITVIKLLYKTGLIQDFWLERGSNLKIVINLKTYSNFSNYKTFTIVSKPSRPLFFSYKDIFKLYEKHILYFFSTSLGILTSFDCKKKKIGGFLFFYAK